MKTRVVVLSFAIFVASVFPSMAGPIMASFDGAPTGWTTDRYQPATFADIGTYAGRDNVLEIGISRDQGTGARPSGQQDTFYNTQGMKQAIVGGAGDSLEADLWVDPTWFEDDATSVRTDMWGRTGLVGDETGVSYPIFGFTNYGDAGARFRVWDEDTLTGWVDVGLSGVTQNAWNSLKIDYTGNSFLYYLNGSLVYTDNTVATPGAQFTDVIMQAYNFFDPALMQEGAVADNYSVHWSNAQDKTVPEPATLSMLGLGLAFFGTKMKRRKTHKSTI